MLLQINNRQGLNSRTYVQLLEELHSLPSIRQLLISISSTLGLQAVEVQCWSLPITLNLGMLSRPKGSSKLDILNWMSKWKSEQITKEVVHHPQKNVLSQNISKACMTLLCTWENKQYRILDVLDQYSKQIELELTIVCQKLLKIYSNHTSSQQHKIEFKGNRHIIIM